MIPLQQFECPWDAVYRRHVTMNRTKYSTYVHVSRTNHIILVAGAMVEVSWLKRQPHCLHTLLGLQSYRLSVGIHQYAGCLVKLSTGRGNT